MSQLIHAVAEQNSLDQLENRSIHILREAYASFRSLAMLWSVGKDSTVLLWLARKAFFGHVPFPLIHIDTHFKIPEMIAYRDRMAREWGITLLVGQNEAALERKRTFPDGVVDRLTCCSLLKTQALKNVLAGRSRRYRLDLATGRYVPDQNQEPFTGVIVGIRADEEGTRSKERYFSCRDNDGRWEIGDQPPEFWNQYNTDFPPGAHARIHPLLDWKESDIWDYIEREKIPTVSLYYDRGEGRRYRSLGCSPCTSSIPSTSKNPAEIIEEIKNGRLKNVPERSGRAQDKEGRGTLEELRRDGYM